MLPLSIKQFNNCVLKETPNKLGQFQQHPCPENICKHAPVLESLIDCSCRDQTTGSIFLKLFSHLLGTPWAVEIS